MVLKDVVVDSERFMIDCAPAEVSFIIISVPDTGATTICTTIATALAYRSVVADVQNYAATLLQQTTR